MTYAELLEKIGPAYDPDGLPEEGDTLAAFIRSELKDARTTFSEKEEVEQDPVDLKEAHRMMRVAAAQVIAVADMIAALIGTETSA